MIVYNIKKIQNIYDAKSNFDEYILQRTGWGESQYLESLMKRIAEMNETKLKCEYLVPHSKRYLFRVIF